MKIHISNLNTIKVNIDAVEYPVNRIILQEQGQQPIDIYVKNDFASQCFTIESLVSNNSITFTKSNYAQISTMYVSEDNGETWAEKSNNAGWSWSLPNIGDKLLIKGTATLYDSCNFTATGNIKVYGSIMSLLYDDNFVGQTSLPQEQYLFYDLFNGCTTLVDASNLVLPATTLESKCYQRMFKGCTSLTTAPALPATTLVSGCYSNMFEGCTSLTTAPELPATTLATSCYSDMFYGCTSLVYVPTILPATTLVGDCYYNMFYGCTSLTTAPILPAATLAQHCYRNIFRECTSLNYIKCLATDISATSCTWDWVNNVAASGTFVKASNMSSWVIDSVDGIPTGWTVENATA